MAASQYLEVVEAATRSSDPIEDNEEEGLELLEATMIDQDEFENVFDMAGYGSEMVNHKQGRHSYNYYSSNFS